MQLNKLTAADGRDAFAPNFRDRRATALVDAYATHAGWSLCALLLLVLIGLHPFSDPGGEGDLTGDGDILRQLSYILVFGYVLITQRALSSAFLIRVIPVTIATLFAWCLLSIFWAIDPGIAFRRLALTIMIVTTTFICVVRAGPERTIAIVQCVLLFLLLANYVAVAVSPYGVHLASDWETELAGNWRGLLKHKNFAGPVCAMTLMFYLFADPVGSKALRWPVILLSTFFLYMTHSKTAIGILGLSILVGTAYLWVGQRGRVVLLVLGALSLLAISLLVTLNIDWIAAIFDSPDALTGRAQIWPILIYYSKENLIFGSGYGSFWNIGSASPVLASTGGWISHISSGHNGYLDVLVQIGVPGLMMAVIALFIVPIVALLTSSRPTRQHGALAISILIFCVGHNLTESSMLDRDHIVWVFLLIGIALTTSIRSGRLDG